MTRRYVYPIVLLILAAVLAGAACAGTVSIIGGGAKGWDGWTSIGHGWEQTTRPRQGNLTPTYAHTESSEQGQGTFRSPGFTVRGDVIELLANGWDSREGGLGQNRFLLRLKKDDSIVRACSPPLQDSFVPVSWYVSDLKGETVYFEAVDGISAPGFAWVGLVYLMEKKLDVPTEASPFSSIPIQAASTWANMLLTGGGPSETRYLSSLGQRESGTGELASPPFTVSEPRIRLKVRGWDGKDGNLGRNWFQLCDATTGEILRKSQPPCSDYAQWIEWEVTALAGRSVKVRLVDRNSDSSYAWLGIDELDAGHALRLKFSEPESTEGWTANAREPDFCTIGGIPFLASPGTFAVEDTYSAVHVGCRAKTIFLLGMTSSLDQGCPTWFTPEVHSLRFFIGDSMGRIEVGYEDGTVDRYPLILGESLWWGRRFNEFPEPFASHGNARAALEKSLRLYPARPTPDGRYLAAIKPRPDRIEYVSVVDTPAKAGTPVIQAVTVELAPGETTGYGDALPHEKLSPDVASFVERRALRRTGLRETVAAQHVRALREALYTTVSNFPKHVPLTVPIGYKGPQFRFAGDSYAEVLTNILYANLHDISRRVTPDGMYHTSANGASSWGGYEGFGTYRDGVGSYYTQSWTRDMGRSLGELCAFGYLEEAKLCADYTLRKARVWEEQPGLKLDGVTLPRHICRVLQMPSTEPGQGCFENDGHGMTALFIYNLWRHLPDRDRWLRDRWKDIQGLGDWVVWQLEHPAISASKGVLRTDSECSAGIGYSVYADVACIEALRALADMADSIGESEKASVWRDASRIMHEACKDAYIVVDPKFGRTWTLDSSGWPDRSTVMGPIILPPDRTGFLCAARDPWKPYNEAAYQRQITAHKPFGFFGVAMGYGQGFVTQSALLLDKMNDATKMLQWAAKATYSSFFKPYIVPEGCEVDPTGTFWHRTGDLGNGVQQAEIVKALRIVIGVDDTSTDALRICPRLPNGWTGIDVTDYPVLISRAGKPETARVSYKLRRVGSGTELALTSDIPLGKIDLRLGPFPAHMKSARVYADGSTYRVAARYSGDSAWIGVRLNAVRTKHTIRVAEFR